MYNAGMTIGMLTYERLACGYIAGEAFFVCGGVRLVVRTPGVHPGNVSSILAPRAIVFSGANAAETASAPDHQPRDLTPKKMTASRNIAPSSSIFHTAVHAPQVTDLTRHEYPFPRKANRDHRRPV